MEENQKDSLKNQNKTNFLLKFVAVLLLITSTVMIGLIFKINETNNNLNRLSYILEKETESHQYKDTIDVFLEETENGEVVLPMYDEYKTTINMEATTIPPEITSDKNISIETSLNDYDNHVEQTSKNISSTRDYVINVNSNKIHYSACTFVSRMKDENKKEITLTKDELNNYLNSGYTLCSTCGG